MLFVCKQKIKYQRRISYLCSYWCSSVLKSNDPNYIMAVRPQLPAPSMDDEDHNELDWILTRRHPYNATTRDCDDRTRISGIVGAPAGDDPGVLYSVHYVEEGKQPQEAMKAKLDLLLEGIEIRDRKSTRLNSSH